MLVQHRNGSGGQTRRLITSVMALERGHAFFQCSVRADPAALEARYEKTCGRFVEILPADAR